MIKSMILVLCVLGIAQAATLSNKCTLPKKKVTSEFKDWLKTSFQIGELVETYKHTIDGLEHRVLNHRKIAINNGKHVLDLFKDDNSLWAELGEEAGHRIFKLVNTLYSQFDHTKFNRTRRATDEATEEGLDELEEIHKALQAAIERDAAEKIEKIKILIDNLERGSGVIRKAVENKNVEEIYNFVCKAAGALVKKPAKFTGIDFLKANNKSTKAKICSTQTFDQVKNVITKGHIFFVKAKEVLSQQNLHKVMDVAETFKNWFESNKH